MNMKLLVVVLIASVTGAGCATQNKIERPGYAYGCPGDSDKIKSKSDLINAKLEMAGSIPNIDVVDLRCTERTGPLRIDVDFKNTGNETRRIAYRFRWLDREGMRAWDDETWKPLLIYGNTQYTVTTTAPTQEAVDFKVVVMDQEKPQ
ncbi:MAG: YcfL family protein [Betaproteobacteria bacterium]